ncbi:sulfate adenylyltransferase subunit 2 [Azospirillum fermentarium]|uniref:sulfate adenylyltransferase subunit CysD n=1 Tax=Azospirillum fermentarium TaxID=1233114 RepID=UPI0022270749|nr:sulfate adenylyltransferase subunit CysD [Azospirillum fermentarium]MCW2249491.1 sulfate adenylyltransferase subunit 2 [Azospirillum fermentarium]
MSRDPVSSDLEELEARTLYILREAFAEIRPLAMLWSIGKDSTALLWMVRKAFFGRVPFPMVQLDTGMELPEVYEFRDAMARDWNLDLQVVDCPPEEVMDPTLPPGGRAAARKTEGLKALLRTHGYKGIFLGIRRDEQSMRAKERVFSPRGEDGAWNFKDQPAEFWDQYKTEVPEGAHLRIHPLLHWTELDIWRYTRQEGIPIVPLYLARDGMRYRSLGEKNITVPIPSTAATIDEIIAELETSRTPERAGRTMDHESEDAFERLRRSGYM